MLAHINRLRSLHDQLNEMGLRIDDKELAMTLLASLPEQFKPLITALDAVGEDNLSFEKVKGMLLNDSVRKEDNLNLKKSEDALSASRAFPQNRRGGRGRSRSSGEGGNLDSKPARAFRGTCHFCHEQGHFARDCPKRNFRNSQNVSSGNSRNQKSANSADNEESDEQFNDEALYSAEDTKAGGSWIIDSGATKHMTFERNSLSSYIEFKTPSPVTLGDNRVIFAYGKVCTD